LPFYGRTLNSFIDDLKKNPRYDAHKIKLDNLQKSAAAFEATGKNVKTLLDHRVAPEK